MGEAERWPLQVTPISAVSTGSLLWHLGGQLHVTLVVKARFWLRHGQRAELASPAPVARQDEHYDDSPLRSVGQSSDLAPYRQRCDVWVVGHCCAPPGQPVPRAAVRLAVFRDDRALIDKVLHVYGDRRSADDRAAPFERMALSYERAFGGPDVLNNPVGVGMGSAEPPNVVHPEFPSRPAGFAPIPRYWRSRLFELPQQVRDDLEMPVIALPDGFDWGYFQTAPRDQQIEDWSGREWLVLDGMHPALPRLQCRLPAVTARARLWSVHASADLPGHEIVLTADTLAIDADAQTCTLTWRGSFPLQSVEILDTIRVGAGLEWPGVPLDWAPFWDASPATPPPPRQPEAAAVGVDAKGTVVALADTARAAGTATLNLGDWDAARRGPLAKTVPGWPVPSAAGAAKATPDPLLHTAILPPEGAPGVPPLQPAPLRPAAIPGAPWDQVVVPPHGGRAAVDPLATTSPSAPPPSLDAPATPPSIPPPARAPSAAPSEPPAATAEHGSPPPDPTNTDDP